MDLSTILSVLHDVAQTLCSFIQLFFTQIIPVFAIFIASLISRIFCSIRSFVAGAPKSRRSSLRYPVAPDMCESPQEESDEDYDEMAPRDDGFFSDEQSLPQVDDAGVSTVRRNERQRSLATQEREIPDELLVRDSSTHNEIPAAAPMVFPSDLPESLDDVERKPNADNLTSQQKRTLPPSLSMVKKTLRESSEKAFVEEESQEIAVGGATRRRTSKHGKATATANEKASRSQSEKLTPSNNPAENAVAKFQKYFSMG